MKIEFAVYCNINLPINEDMPAVTKAVNDLMKEGWSFNLYASGIVMSRSWLCYEPQRQVEVK